MVFDGLMPHIAAGKKMFTNYRFAQPGRNMQEHGETLYPGTAFPFTYPVTTDAVTGRTDGWLARCRAANNCPKIIQTDTDWNSTSRSVRWWRPTPRASRSPCPTMCGSIYLASLQHAAAAGAKSGTEPLCTYPTNPLYAGPVLRALLVALETWIADGTRAAGEPLSEPRRRHAGDARRERQELPQRSGLQLRRPRASADRRRSRRDAAGEDRPPIRCSCRRSTPTATPSPASGCRRWSHRSRTHLGWNVRKAGFGEGGLCGNFGSMLPFAKTREERSKTNDPRLSLEERYPTAPARAAIIEQTARKLVQERLLLEDDVQGYLQATN